MPRKPPVQKFNVPDLDPYRTFTDQQIEAMAKDHRSCGTLAILYGTTRQRVKHLRRKYVQKMRDQGTFK